MDDDRLRRGVGGGARTVREPARAEADLIDPAAYIDAAGVRRTGAVELFREEPWSTVWHALTADGTVWLKRCAPAVAFEARLYELLERVVPDRILRPLAVDCDRGLILLPDGGEVGNDVTSALPAYARLQRALAPHVDELLALGVADMRPAVMTTRLEEAGRATGVDVAPVRERFAAACERLASAPGGASLDHNDLHSHNVLAGDRFYDWGDAVVAHPFASLLLPLELAADPDAARAAYLGEFTDLAPLPALEAAAADAVRVARVARALVWHRAMPGDDAARLTLEQLLDSP